MPSCEGQRKLLDLLAVFVGAVMRVLARILRPKSPFHAPEKTGPTLQPSVTSNLPRVSPPQVDMVTIQVALWVMARKWKE